MGIVVVSINSGGTLIRLSIGFVFLILSAGTALASSLHSYCLLNESSPTAIHGYETELKLPIASVSKLLTSYWALQSLGTKYRFLTTVFYKKNSDKSADVHFQGGNDPFFGKEILHYTISELNKIGIKSVRQISFDENFKFRWSVTNSQTAVGTYKIESPTPDDVLNQFLKAKNLTLDYAKTLTFAKSQSIQMVPAAQLLVKSYAFLKSIDFDAREFQFIQIKSSPLPILLKEMNRNSNNYSANIIFEFLGGAKKFKSFIERRLSYTSDDIEFYNGSGDRFDSDEIKYYNSAKCSVILRVLVDLESILSNLNLKFEDIASVVGADSTSVASSLYKNEVTENSVIAKTGTVDPAILLAGTISTKKGKVYFMYNMKTNGTRRDWREAQRKIKLQITSLIQNTYNGGVPIKYEAITFFPFDREESETKVLTP